MYSLLEIQWLIATVQSIPSGAMQIWYLCAFNSVNSRNWSAFTVISLLWTLTSLIIGIVSQSSKLQSLQGSVSLTSGDVMTELNRKALGLTDYSEEYATKYWISFGSLILNDFILRSLSVGLWQGFVLF